MDSWWERWFGELDWAKVGCGVVIAALLYAAYWLVFEASFTIKVTVAVLVAAFGYIIYTSGGDEEDDPDDF